MTANGASCDLYAHTKQRRFHAIGTLSAIAVVSVQAWSRDSCPDQCLSEAQEPQRRGYLYAKGAATSFDDKSADVIHHRSPISIASRPPSAAPADWVALRVPLRDRIAEIARGAASGPGPPSAAALLPWTRARTAGLSCGRRAH